MTTILKYIISIISILAFSIHFVMAQSVILPSAVRIGTDVSKLGIWALNPERQQYEINADIDVYKYFLTCDYGGWKTNIPGGDFDYHMNGNYFRAGIDYNFIYSDKDNHVIFFGLRYALASYDETLNYNISDPYYGSSSGLLTKPGGKAHWIEMVTGLKAHIWKGLYMGWSGRMQFGLSTKSAGDFNSYEIPGFGKSSGGTSSWELNYNIYYRFEFRKKPRIQPKPEKKK